MIVDDPEVRRHQILGSLDVQPSPFVRFAQIDWGQRNMHLVYGKGYESLQQPGGALHIGDYREESTAESTLQAPATNLGVIAVIHRWQSDSARIALGSFKTLLGGERR